MGQKKPCVVYDLDGVLADTFLISLKVANLLVEMYGKRYGLKKIEPVDISRYRNMGPDQIRKALGVPITLIPFIYREGKRLLAEETPKAKAFDGIYETVNAIHQNNQYDQLILTSNSRENTCGFLENNGLLEFFVNLYTDFPLLSKRAGLMQILSKKGITREEMVFVCDEVRDIHAAQGWEATLFGLIKPIPVISVGWGYNTPEALIAENPTAHISDPRELPELLERLFNGK